MLVGPAQMVMVTQGVWLLWRMEEETVQPVQQLMSLAIFLEVSMMETEELNPAVVVSLVLGVPSCHHLQMEVDDGQSAQQDKLAVF